MRLRARRAGFGRSPSYNGGMTRETFPVGPLGCNCSLVVCESTRQALVIDPGDEAPEILRRVAERGLSLVGIFHTHAHFDHVGGTLGVREASGAPVMLHPGDRPLYEMVPLQGQMFGMQVAAPPPVDRWLEDGDVVAIGTLAGRVLHTPGHTPGSICLHLGEQRVVFTGDTLFARGVGRTDLWGGSFEALIESIHDKLLTLPDDTMVVPGHGGETTVGRERAANPFLERA